MASKLVKRCSTSYVNGKCKLKPDTTIYLTVCPKSEKMTMPVVNNANSHFGRQNGTATFWWFLTKVNIPLPYYPAFTLLGIYPKDLRLMFTQKSAHRCF